MSGTGRATTRSSFRNAMTKGPVSSLPLIKHAICCSIESGQGPSGPDEVNESFRSPNSTPILSTKHRQFRRPMVGPRRSTWPHRRAVLRDAGEGDDGHRGVGGRRSGRCRRGSIFRRSPHNATGLAKSVSHHSGGCHDHRDWPLSSSALTGIAWPLETSANFRVALAPTTEAQ